MNWIKSKIWRPIRIKARVFAIRNPYLFAWLFSIILIISIYLVVGLAWIRLRAAQGIATESIALFPHRMLLEWIIGGSDQQVPNVIVYGHMVEIILVVIGMIVVLIPILAAKGAVSRIRAQSALQIFPISDKASALSVVAAFYKDCDDITVWSGDFSWILEPAIKGIIVELCREGKISFITSRNRDLVINNILSDTSYSGIFEDKIRERSGSKIVCSLIRYKGREVLLYQSHGIRYGANNSDLDSICVLQDINEGRYLLKTFAELAAR